MSLISEREIKKLEKASILQILAAGFKSHPDNTLSGEDVHIYVEDQRKCLTKFHLILECMKEIYPEVQFDDNNGRYSISAYTNKIDQFASIQKEQAVMYSISPFVHQK
ncbi:hypothetical protein DPMN_075795 [Dreissena polymorpha]|uniref:Uncharacterized protein n=1 Tax=Dreissena polymorpha TaxID=45954 RepID=A0A9D4BF79_DREPO|nr:hypothetical protein DPMN_075795 [Dreissena polymorpha]